MPRRVNAIETMPFGKIGMLILIVIALGGTFYTVGAGERGVVLTFGKAEMKAMDPGLHVKFPFAQSVKKMDVRTQKYEVGASAASKDLQIVTTTLAVNFYVEPSTVPVIYKEIGINYEFKIIQPAVQEVIKAVTARFTAEELITKRSEVKEMILISLQERIVERGINVQDVSITNFDFSESFNAAIEAKVTAEQLKLKAERDLQRIEIEAQQKIEVAKAEAESIRIQAEALSKGKDVIELRWIEAWNGVMPTYYAPGGSASTLVSIPIQG